MGKLLTMLRRFYHWRIRIVIFEQGKGWFPRKEEGEASTGKACESQKPDTL